MKKNLSVLGAVLLVCMGIQNAMAASGKCTIVKIEGKQMVLECKKDLGQFSEGDNIKIKSAKKSSIEGC